MCDCKCVNINVYIVYRPTDVCYFDRECVYIYIYIYMNNICNKFSGSI